MKIQVTTPNRVDFAGGTLDLYPLYLLFEGGLTINAGITVFSNVVIETRNDPEIHINSRDLKIEEKYDNLDSLTLQGPSALIQRAVKSYSPAFGINISTFNHAPKGSGLGASSSLLIALSVALQKIRNPDTEIDETRLIDRAAAIEAALLGIPTGKQDYYGAYLGKVHALHFDEKGCDYRSLIINSNFEEQLNQCLTVSFTGISHYSGANNWDMLKMAIEKQGATYENLLKIKEVTQKMEEAFKEEDIEKIGNLVNQEWKYRKILSPGVTNDFIDNIISALEEVGAYGSKLCGAGGGGCMITLASPDKKEKIKAKLEDMGVRVMDARIASHGVNIEIKKQPANV